MWESMRRCIRKKCRYVEREGVIIPVYKGKGDIQDCSNYRGIKLKSQTRKILKRMIKNGYDVKWRSVNNNLEISEHRSIVKYIV